MHGEVSGIGTRLRAGRDKLGLTILQAAEKLHTDPKILEALEADDFESLGAPVYARGHLRHYAEFVGESVSQLSELYGDTVKTAPPPDLTRIARAPSAEESNRLVAPALLVLSIFAVAGAVWWVLTLSGQKPHPDQAHIIGPAAAESAATAAPSEVSPDARPAADSQSPPAAPADAARPHSNSTTPAGAVPTASTIPPVSHAGPGAPGTRLASAAPGDADAGAIAGAPGNLAGSAAVHAGRDGQVVLHYGADSWTEVYDASGARLFYDVGAADSVRTVNGALPLRLVLGNASGVTIEVNGRSTPASKWALPDGSAQLLINRAGHAVRAHPATDGG
ncbi:MAG: helix-turn-helix domain-containing protein [Sinobacteraceae bacterium]|nr:helix-turn-helix domain-containing protein [Nevskiaceae bacterium]